VNQISGKTLGAGLTVARLRCLVLTEHIGVCWDKMGAFLETFLEAARRMRSEEGDISLDSSIRSEKTLKRIEEEEILGRLMLMLTVGSHKNICDSSLSFICRLEEMTLIISWPSLRPE